MNLYAFIRNNAINRWDYLGMWDVVYNDDGTITASENFYNDAGDNWVSYSFNSEAELQAFLLSAPIPTGGAGIDDLETPGAPARGMGALFGQLGSIAGMSGSAFMDSRYGTPDPVTLFAGPMGKKVSVRLAPTEYHGEAKKDAAPGNTNAQPSAGSGRPVGWSLNAWNPAGLNPMAPNNTATTNTGTNLTTAVVAGTTIAIPGTLAGGGGGITAGEVIAGATRAGPLVAGAAVVMSIPGDTYRNPNLVSFRRYDYAAAAPLYLTVGRNIPTTFAAPMSDPLVSSSQAQALYALPGAPRDAYYIITIDPRDNPYNGPTVVQPKFGQPGGGNEVLILGPIPAPQITGPYPLPPDPKP